LALCRWANMRAAARAGGCVCSAGGGGRGARAGGGRTGAAHER
jgi:hypothetical protein